MTFGHRGTFVVCIGLARRWACPGVDHQLELESFEVMLL